jgi:hypothetical protein
MSSIDRDFQAEYGINNCVLAYGEDNSEGDGYVFHMRSPKIYNPVAWMKVDLHKHFKFYDDHIASYLCSI